MNGKTIRIIEEEIDDISYLSQKPKEVLDDINNTFMNDFRPLTNTNVYSNGVQTIGNQVKKISESINSTRNLILNQTREFFETESMLASVAEQIKIPTDFSINGNFYDNSIKDILLTKEDNGKSVSSVRETDTISYNDNYDRVNIRLKNILNDNNQEVTNINDRYDIDKINVDNIKNMNDTLEQQIDTNYDVNKISMSNIKNNVNLNTNTMYNEPIKYTGKFDLDEK